MVLDSQHPPKLVREAHRAKKGFQLSYWDNAMEGARVLAVASGGGHWIQLLRLTPAWAGVDCAYMTTNAGLERDLPGGRGSDQRFYVVPDANRSRKLDLVHQVAAVGRVVLRERPTVVITTGASVGFFALVVAKMIGSRTVWLDSVANADELSLSGKRAGRFADLWLTQWPDLAKGQAGLKDGPSYRGSVL